MSYQLFCKSIQGAKHIRKGMPSEDYGLKYEDHDVGCKIFVLGDGHGDVNCPRSSYGSRAVCEIVKDELLSFARTLKESKQRIGYMRESPPASDFDEWSVPSAPKSLFDKLMDPYTAPELVHQLIRSIVGKWGLRVTEHFADHPLTPEEEEAAKKWIETYRRGERIEHIYGTTMIAGLMTEDYLLLLQQGDGRCVVFDENGEVSQPIPWDDRCVGSVTSSMCEYDAAESCRFHIIDLRQNPIIACALGSDGVEDSFASMDGMHVFYREQLSVACEVGVEGLEIYWESSLPTLSEKGSFDDITICGLIDVDAFSGKLEFMELENEMTVLKESLKQIDDRLPNMKAKEEFLFNRQVNSAKTYQAILDRMTELEKEYNNIQGDLQELQKVGAFSVETESTFSVFSNNLTQWVARYIHISMDSKGCLERRLESIRKERDSVEAELKLAEKNHLQNREEYIDYQKKRLELEETRNRKELKLLKLKNDYAVALATPTAEPRPCGEVCPPTPNGEINEEKAHTFFPQETDAGENGRTTGETSDGVGREASMPASEARPQEAPRSDETLAEKEVPEPVKEAREGTASEDAAFGCARAYGVLPEDIFPNAE